MVALANLLTSSGSLDGACCKALAGHCINSAGGLSLCSAFVQCCRVVLSTCRAVCDSQGCPVSRAKALDGCKCKQHMLWLAGAPDCDDRLRVAPAGDIQGGYMWMGWPDQVLGLRRDSRGV